MAKVKAENKRMFEAADTMMVSIKLLKKMVTLPPKAKAQLGPIVKSTLGEIDKAYGVFKTCFSPVKNNKKK